jgi:hypothetical protein
VTNADLKHRCTGKLTVQYLHLFEACIDPVRARQHGNSAGYSHRSLRRVQRLLSQAGEDSLGVYRTW